MLAVLTLIVALQVEAPAATEPSPEESAALAEVACAAGLPEGLKPQTKEERRCEAAARDAAAIADSMAAVAFNSAQAARLLAVCEALKVEAIQLRPLVGTIKSDAESRRAHNALDRMALAYREACL